MCAFHSFLLLQVQKGDPPQQPVCVLNIVLPDDIIPESSTAESTPQKQTYSYSFTNGMFCRPVSVSVYFARAFSRF